MSTEDVTLEHVKKMLGDAKVAAGCRKTCKHTVTESEENDTKFFTITHESDKAIDSYSIPAASMDLMEEMALANFLLARHETTRLAQKQATEEREARAEADRLARLAENGGIPSSLDILAEEKKVWDEEFARG